MSPHTRRPDPQALVDEQMRRARRRTDTFHRHHDGNNRAKSLIDRLL